MGIYRRINVRSGRPLEQLAHYSRALRVGDMVLQSGTTAIDREGNVYGEGDVAKQVDAIMSIASWSMEQAGGRLDDIVRSRIYLTDIALAETAALALAKYFRDVRPVSTLVQVTRLARPTQLIEIEFDAVDGAKDKAQRISSGRDIEDKYAYSRAVRVDDRIFIAGTTALNPDGQVEGGDDMYVQTRRIMDTIHWALEEAGGRLEDLVYSKSFVTDLAKGSDYTRAFLEAVGAIRPTSTLLGIPALIRPQMLVEIEAEALIGAAEHRRELFTEQERERALGYARAVEVGDRIFVSGCTALSPAGEPRALADWAAQYDLALATIATMLEQAGAQLDDVVRRRTFTVDGAHQNRSYGDGPPLFVGSCPVSLGCRVAGLALPELLVEVEAEAWKGAHADIEWIGPAEPDPLRAAPRR